MLIPRLDIRKLYDAFDVPVVDGDCGQLCAPYNPSGKPFCCDICHAVPAALQQEWDYLQQHTDLWHLWRGDECPAEQVDPTTLQAETPEHMCLLACLGPELCQREYRAMSCRQFPFFPYITADDRLIGMAYNWDFEDTCWVISHLGAVTAAFRQAFIQTYDHLLSAYPEEYDSYYYLSEEMREHFAAKRRNIPILHRNGGYYLLSPGSERLQRVAPDKFHKFGPYRR